MSSQGQNPIPIIAAMNLKQELLAWLKRRLMGIVQIHAVADTSALAKFPSAQLLLLDASDAQVAAALLADLRPHRPDLAVFCLIDPSAPRTIQNRLVHELSVRQLIFHPVDDEALAAQIAGYLKMKLPKSSIESSKEAKIAASIAGLWEKYRPLNLERIQLLDKASVAMKNGALDFELRQRAEQEAHKLAGSAGSFGFAEISRIAREMELTLRDGDAIPPDRAAQFAQNASALRERMGRVEPDPLSKREPVRNETEKSTKSIFADRTNWNLSKNRFTVALEEQRREGKRLLDLTVSNPTECGFEFPKNEILGAMAQPESLKYAPESQGLFVARNAVARYYAELSSPESVLPEHIVLTTSTSEGYSFIFRLLCNPGDEVLVPQPSYPLFDFLADIQDVRLVPYPLIYDHGWQIDLHSLRKALNEKTRATVVVHPNNPTGSFVHANEAAELNTICAENSLAIVADEVFLDFAHGTQTVKSFAGNNALLTFTLSGLSKIAGLPQMKFAWIGVNGPQELRDEALARLEIIADTYLSMNAPIQHAGPKLLELRNGFQSQLRNRIQTNLRELDRQLALQRICSRLECEAGWYATLRVPVTQSDEHLAIDLMKNASVLVHPGHFFDFRSDGFLILSLMTPEEEFGEGVQRVLFYLNTSN